MTAVYAAGHWRKRDPLEGLTKTMRAAIDELSIGDLWLSAGGYRRATAANAQAFAPSTLVALRARGLAEQRYASVPCGPSLGPFYRATRNGRAIAAVIRRRAETRARLLKSA
jgi:hypothetical protein